ncbi:NDP-hexose 2,3-dehydratase family protein [Ferrimonas aestuarii]|uniref:Response regulator receiver protein n=1 Tax=Ferrimonas aestuarii TaxID=2569539 RepID=A0A4V5NZ74_9GAMM|nr:NDP-hexose 2,3-dehydratase family protein [Ferrimonas aestuarii]TKB53964.1 response regulator receiver protein [Ferrimonas aestuarii]
MPKNYQQSFDIFRDKISEFVSEDTYPHAVEAFFETTRDWNQFHDIEFVKKWFTDKKSSSTLEVVDIPMNDVKGWHVDPETGNIHHESKDFFVIHGVRVKSNNREVELTWDQPILEQVGYDGGILGLVRKRFDGVPHYLCEAKEEPGNYGKVQISPTLQATFANINQSHGGRKPRFSELFLNKESNPDVTVLFDSWLAEDGGRLHLKRNRGILVEVTEDYDISLPNDNFIWLSLYQIKQLLKEDAWINPHVRGILAHV